MGLVLLINSTNDLFIGNKTTFGLINILPSTSPHTPSIYQYQPFLHGKRDICGSIVIIFAGVPFIAKICPFLHPVYLKAPVQYGSRLNFCKMVCGK